MTSCWSSKIRTSRVLAIRPHRIMWTLTLLARSTATMVTTTYRAAHAEVRRTRKIVGPSISLTLPRRRALFLALWEHYQRLQAPLPVIIRCLTSTALWARIFCRVTPPIARKKFVRVRNYNRLLLTRLRRVQSLTTPSIQQHSYVIPRKTWNRHRRRSWLRLILTRRF